nr:MAG TPA_asm: tRNAHis guanylyltransferase [Caudoviricetes sp.]
MQPELHLVQRLLWQMRNLGADEKSGGENIMSFNDSMGTRMKEYYEAVPKTKLMRRTPVAIRVDGKSFHTFTRGFQKPFDMILMKSMQETMMYLCKNIQGCVFGYTQSDEITLILIDYQTLTTDAWFDYEVQKLCSVSASMATMAFNKFFRMSIWDEDSAWKSSLTPQSMDVQIAHNEYVAKMMTAANKGAMFDARCFNIPKEEVCNLIYWRQLDATRNSIQMVGQAYFSHKQLEGKKCNDIQDMLMEQFNINWNNYPTTCKRGTACINKDGQWVLDTNMPILKGEDRKYVDQYIFVGE